MQVTRRFEFDSAHKLGKEFGKDQNLHGHRYMLEVTIDGPVKNNVVLDIAKIKEIVKKEIIEKLDHNNLNKYLDDPTAENIVIWIWDKLKDKLGLLYELRLYETPNNYVTYRGD